MDSYTILISGITGFIGSNIVETCLANGYKVIGIIKKDSNLWRIKDISNPNLFLVLIDDDSFEKKVIKYNPNVFINASWIGVSAKDRINWNVQIENIVLFTKLCEFAKKTGITKIITFGSQAEIGHFSGRVDENIKCNPNTSYGVAKLSCLNVLRAYCESNNIEWYWLRLFSIFGPKEDKHWLIPSVIENATKGIEMSLTLCEQKYDYLYIDELSNAIIKVIESNAQSGIYNLTSNNSIKLRDMIEYIKNIINPNVNFNYGAISYRENQVMHMEGNSELFYKTFKYAPKNTLDHELKTTIEYYMHRIKI